MESLEKTTNDKVVIGHYWPWEDEWWRPSDDPIRNLVKAGALIAAEIDRLQRCKTDEPAPPGQALTAKDFGGVMPQPAIP